MSCNTTPQHRHALVGVWVLASAAHGLLWLATATCMYLGYQGVITPALAAQHDPKGLEPFLAVGEAATFTAA
jgi:hypothetical protein